MYKYSLIVTVLNEEHTIQSLLVSVSIQEVLPHEVIIVDGGSTDRTLQIIDEYTAKSYLKSRLHVLRKKGNRSVGRNEAIKMATGDIILITDAGCILDKDWGKNISEPFKDEKTEAVAGYYKAKAKTIFQKCLVPYVLVMPDKVNPSTFLPATRSMAIRKSVWKEIGGFDEQYSHNEDYVFARKLRDVGKKIVFAKEAIVYWIPRSTFREAFKMFYRFAYGDMESGIIRPKVVFLILRYVIAGILLIIDIFLRSYFLSVLLFFFALVYILWTIQKNYPYIKDIKDFYYLPLIQFIADFAVIKGSIKGYLVRKHSNTV